MNIREKRELLAAVHDSMGAQTLSAMLKCETRLQLHACMTEVSYRTKHGTTKCTSQNKEPVGRLGEKKPKQDWITEQRVREVRARG